MKMKIFLISFTILQYIANPAFSQNNDWPCWRGSNGDGISTETNWNPAALKNGAKILWRANVGQGHSTVSIKDGLLYTQGSCSKKQNGIELYEELVFCFNAQTGEKIWSFSYPSTSMNHGGPRATPTIDGTNVYTLGSKGHIFCLESKTGKVVWKKNPVAEELTNDSKWGFSGSPVIDGDFLIFNIGTSGLCLNKNTGSVIWKSGTNTWGLATPVLTKIQDRRIVLFNPEFTLYAVNTANGNIEWTYPWPYGDADPVLVQDKIYVIGGKPGNKRCRALVNISDGKEYKSWTHRKMNVNFITSIVYKNCIYGITWDKKKHHLQCFDLRSEKVVWQQRLDDWSAFSMANGYIIMIEANGELSILEGSTKSYKKISSAKVFEIKNRKDSEDQPLTCWTAPVLCDGKIYVRNTYGDIACVNMRN